VANDPTGGAVSTLVLTRPDGSTYAFDDVTVSCDPPKTTAGDPISDGPGRIWMYSPMKFTGSEAEDDVRVTEPFVYFEGVVDKLQGDRALDLPVWGPGDSSTYPMTLFVADSVDDNEAASSAGGSGTVRVLRAACEPTPVLELEVDGTLASEVRRGDLHLAGAVR
jgi:hypothetical protein